MTSGAKTPVFMEPLEARLKGVPFPQRRKARARCPFDKLRAGPHDSRRDAGATVFFPLR
jgi:hypothetical protein